MERITCRAKISLFQMAIAAVISVCVPQAVLAEDTWPQRLPSPEPPPVIVDGHTVGVSLVEPTELKALVWWESQFGARLFANERPEELALSLPQCLRLALENAPELRMLQHDFEIRLAEVIRQDAAFDWHSFVQTIWNRDSNPVGSQLDGAADRLRSRSWSGSLGVRRRLRSGGELELTQDFGFLNSNSQFITPNNQGTSRIAMQYEQPLWRNRGQQVNESALQLADLDKSLSYDSLQIGIQDYLLSLVQSYWSLVLARGQYVQHRESLRLAEELSVDLEKRPEGAVRRRHANRIQQEVINRRAAAAESRARALRAQERLLRVIYGSIYPEYTHHEVLTTTVPTHKSERVGLDNVSEIALQHRPEVHQAILQIRAASVQACVAASELLPELNLVLSGYSAGLRSDVDMGQAFLDQFSTGEPGVGTGLNFEFPLRNRAAKAAMRQRQLAIARFRNQFQVTTSEITLNVRESATEKNKFQGLLPLRLEGLLHAREDLTYAHTEREFLIGGGRLEDLYLQDLLGSQIRLVVAESQYLGTQVENEIAQVRLFRALGQLGESSFDGPSE